MDNLYYLISILIFIIIIILAKRLFPVKQKKIVDKFISGDLASSEAEVLIRKQISNLVERRFKELKLVNDNENEDSFNLLQDESPLGMISHFYKNPNINPNDPYWLECNGQIIYKDDYPDFFKFLNKDLQSGETQIDRMNLPNLVGRVIVGAGNIFNSENTINTNSIYNDNNKPFNFEDGNQTAYYASGSTGGYDVCNNTILLKKIANNDSVENKVNICSSINNMPPHYNLTAYIKVKTDKFNINF